MIELQDIATIEENYYGGNVNLAHRGVQRRRGEGDEREERGEASGIECFKWVRERKGERDLSSFFPSMGFCTMIREAILTLKVWTGSSHQVIVKFTEEKYKKVLPPNFKKVFSIQLKRFVKSERLVKIKNSFKVSSTEKVKLVVKEKDTNKKEDNITKTWKAVTPNKIAEKKGVKTKRLS
ncbi:histone H1-like [Juglans microcarpa x Juglans regia]|uniref:histone H1-like n=1 Tax=Juglans microcarpa x Juglans regia TaxID=2249226 RepID=UPI001B7DC372|nr:histone H1-like [Juglans microcarpa x Juglans regia]